MGEPHERDGEKIHEGGGVVVGAPRQKQGLGW